MPAAPLTPCPACRRHVRASERACPFCAAALDPVALHARAAARPALTKRLGRAAIFALGGAAIATTASCYQAHGLGIGEGPPDPTPRVDAAIGTDAATPIDAGGSVALYGGPPDPDPVPVDAGADLDSGVTVEPAYGAPPFPIDDLDAGAPMNLYGAAPASHEPDDEPAA